MMLLGRIRSDMSAQKLLIASFVFLAFGMVLHGIGWLTRDLDEDMRIRQGLDKLLDRLDKIPLRDLAHRFLARFQNRWESTFGKTRHGIARFVALSFALNVIAGASLIALSKQTQLILVLAPDELERRMLWRESSFSLTLTLALSAAVAGLAVDLLAKSASSGLLRFALGGKHVGRLIVACLLDVVVLLVAYVISWALGGAIGYLLDPTSSFSRAELLRMFVLPVHALAAALFHPLLNSPFFPTPSAQLAIAILIQIVGASFQTAVYLTLGCCALAARLCPRPIQRILARCILQITTDKKPVFSQLAGGAASISVILAALAGIARLR
jgi:hypothetical protein